MEASCSSAKPGFYLQKPSILQSLSSRPRSCLLAWMSAKTWVSMPYFYVLIGGFVMWMLLAPQELNSKWNLWLVLEGIELKATRRCTVPVKKSAGVKQLGWEQANVSLNTVSSVVDIRGPRKPMGWAESNGFIWMHCTWSTICSTASSERISSDSFRMANTISFNCRDGQR